jgi:drug/metabolite transporter (DMT)-like permease
MLPVILAYAALYLVWSTTYYAMRLSVQDMHPELVIGIRFFFGGLMLLAIAVATGRFPRRPSPPEWRAALLLAVLLVVCGNGMVTWALQKVESYMAALIIATTPLMVAAFNRALLKIPVSGAGLAGILAGLAGVGLILYDGKSIGTSLSPHALIILVAVGCWSLGTSLGRSVKAYPEVLVSSGLQSVLGGLACLVAYLATHHGALPDLTRVSWRSWSALAYLTVPGSLAFLAYGYLITREPSSRVVSYALVNPAIATLLGLGLGEKAAPLLAFGLPLILCGVFLMLYGEALWARLAKPRGPVSPGAG